MIEHGFPRATEDIDLLISSTPDNFNKVKESLLILPDQAAKDLLLSDLDQYIVVRVADEIVVDVMKSACGIEYPEAENEIEWVEIDHVPIPFASASLMLKLKQGVREKDVIDRKFLEQIIAQRKS